MNRNEAAVIGINRIFHELYYKEEALEIVEKEGIELELIQREYVSEQLKNKGKTKIIKKNRYLKKIWII